MITTLFIMVLVLVFFQWVQCGAIKDLEERIDDIENNLAALEELGMFDDKLTIQSN